MKPRFYALSHHHFAAAQISYTGICRIHLIGHRLTKCHYISKSSHWSPRSCHSIIINLLRFTNWRLLSNIIKKNVAERDWLNQPYQLSNRFWRNNIALSLNAISTSSIIVKWSISPFCAPWMLNIPILCKFYRNDKIVSWMHARLVYFRHIWNILALEATFQRSKMPARGRW